MIRQMKWLALASMLIAVSPAMAQPPGGGRPGGGPGGGNGFFGGGQRGGNFGGGFGGGGKFGLLTNAVVQDEIALSDEQKQKIRAVSDSYREALRTNGAGGFEALRDLPQEERQAKRAELMRELNEGRKKVDAEFAPKYSEVLEEVQLSRLQQVYWQVQGINALRDDDLAKALNLSAEQRQKLTAVAEESTPGRTGGAQPGQRRDGPPPTEEERQARREEAEARIQKRNEAYLAVLTPEQKAQFEKLKGAEFDVAKLRRGQGGPGGAGGQGGERRGGDGERRGPGGERRGGGDRPGRNQSL